MERNLYKQPLRRTISELFGTRESKINSCMQQNHHHIMSDPVQLRILVAGGFALNTKITQSSAFISVDNIYDTINKYLSFV